MISEIELIIEIAKNSDISAQGGNSSVTKVIYDSNNYCVKNYSKRSDSQIRMLKEFTSLSKLSFFDSNLFAKPIGYSLDSTVAVYTWIEGERPRLNKFGIDLMLTVLQELSEISLQSKKEDYENATDSVQKFTDISHQLKSRFSKVILNNKFIPDSFFRDIEKSLDIALSERALMGEPNIILSVSDLGPHNLLWDESTKNFHCVDLEFFGWDDANKLLIDTLLHPQIDWSTDLVNYFLKNFETLHKLEYKRLFQMWKLLNLKWAMIILSKLLRSKSEFDRKQSRDSIIDQAQVYIFQSRDNIHSLNDMINLSVQMVKQKLN